MLVQRAFASADVGHDRAFQEWFFSRGLDRTAFPVLVSHGYAQRVLAWAITVGIVLAALLRPRERTPTPSVPTGSPRSIDLVWDEASQIAESQATRLGAVDAKALPFLAFGLAFGAFLRSDPLAVALGEHRDGLTGLAVLGLLCTLGAVRSRPWHRAPDLITFIEDANLDPSRLKEMYLRNLMNAYRHNEIILAWKHRYFQFAWWSYATALVLTFAVTIFP